MAAHSYVTSVYGERLLPGRGVGGTLKGYGPGTYLTFFSTVFPLLFNTFSERYLLACLDIFPLCADGG
jgi:hypothetical protein